MHLFASGQSAAHIIRQEPSLVPFPAFGHGAWSSTLVGRYSHRHLCSERYSCTSSSGRLRACMGLGSKTRSLVITLDYASQQSRHSIGSKTRSLVIHFIACPYIIGARSLVVNFVAYPCSSHSLQRYSRTSSSGRMGHTWARIHLAAISLRWLSASSTLSIKLASLVPFLV